MTITDRSSAPDASFSAALASWESREAAEEGWEQRVERAARAAHDADPSRGQFCNGWPCVTADRYRVIASAALSADAETPGAGEGETAAATKVDHEGRPWTEARARREAGL